MLSVYKNKADCCGCGVCSQICPCHAITMLPDEEGFSYPEIDSSKCIDCKKCRKYCPLAAFQKPDTPYFRVYAAKHGSPEVLDHSSSGGMFTAFSDAVLEKGGCVYGCAYDQNFTLFHQCAHNREERDRLRGSKYVQSELRDCFPQIRTALSAGTPVLFTGTPCQVAALYTFLHGCNTEQLLTVSLICHGVPSPMLFREYLSFCERKRKARIVNYEHRPKHRYWGHIERTKFIYANGDSDSDSVLSQGWKWLFYSNAALRPSCYRCPWSSAGHPSDITIGDFWGIEDCMPDFYDRMGVSLVLLNSRRGEQAFSEIRGDIVFREAVLTDAVKENPNLISPSVPLCGREDFWECYRTKGMGELLRVYGRVNWRYRLKNMLRRIAMKTGLINLYYRWRKRKDG